MIADRFERATHWQREASLAYRCIAPMLAAGSHAHAIYWQKQAAWAAKVAREIRDGKS